MDSDDNSDSHRFINMFAFYMESLSLYTQSIIRQHSYSMRNFIENFQIGEFFDSLCANLAERPVLKFAVLITAVSCAFPLVMFILFVATSIIVTLAGFIFIEGTLLALGGICMLACILSIILVLSILAVILGIFYIVALKLVFILNKFKTTSNLLQAIGPVAIFQEETNPQFNMLSHTHHD